MFGNNFRAPLPKASVEASTFDAGKDKLKKTIEKHLFGHCLDIVIPRSSSIPDSVLSCVTDTDYEYYIARNVPIAKLVDEKFIGAFVRNGKFACVSVGTRVDTDNCIAISHPGKLNMSLTKDAYEELGLDGQPTNVYLRKAQHFDVELDLLASYFVPGKPNYDKVLSRFTELTSLRFDLIFYWEPSDSSTSSRSVFNYFKAWGVKVDICELGLETWHKTSTVFPKMEWKDCKCDSDLADDHIIDNLLECVGLKFLDVDKFISENDYVSSYHCPEPSEVISHTALVRFSGLVAPTLVLSVLDQLRTEMNNGRYPWALLTVHAHEDIPTALKSPHSTRLGKRSNFFSIVLFPNSNYWLYNCSDS